MRGRAEAARRAHNPEVTGSSPVPATLLQNAPLQGCIFVWKESLVDSVHPERYNECAFHSTFIVLTPCREKNYLPFMMLPNMLV
jgi:hypothetical protein